MSLSFVGCGAKTSCVGWLWSNDRLCWLWSDELFSNSLGLIAISSEYKFLQKSPQSCIACWNLRMRSEHHTCKLRGDTQRVDVWADQLQMEMPKRQIGLAYLLPSFTKQNNRRIFCASMCTCILLLVFSEEAFANAAFAHRIVLESSVVSTTASEDAP